MLMANNCIEARASIRLANHRATRRLTIFSTAPQLGKQAEAQARGCPCRGPVSQLTFEKNSFIQDEPD